MLLHTAALTAAQNGEQLVCRDEEEAREYPPLGVQIVIEGLLASLQTVSEAFEVVQSTWRCATVHYDEAFRCIQHYLKNIEIIMYICVYFILLQHYSFYSFKS